MKNTDLHESGRTGAESTGSLGTFIVVIVRGRGKEVGWYWFGRDVCGYRGKAGKAGAAHAVVRIGSRPWSTAGSLGRDCRQPI